MLRRFTGFEVLGVGVWGSRGLRGFRGLWGLGLWGLGDYGCRIWGLGFSRGFGFWV